MYFMIGKLIVIVTKGMKMFNKLISKIKNEIKELSTVELKEAKFYRYEFKFKTYDGEIEEVITKKYYTWDKDQFVRLEVLNSNCLRYDGKYYSHITCVEEVKVYDEMMLFYEDDLDVMYHIGRCASKERIEEYNEKIFNKYGGIK